MDKTGENRPRSIYQYSSMAPRLSGQNCKFFKFLLSLNSHRRLGYKENNTKYRRYTRKPRAHVRILIYRTWPIEMDCIWVNSKNVGPPLFRFMSVYIKISFTLRKIILSCYVALILLMKDYCSANLTFRRLAHNLQN